MKLIKKQMIATELVVVPGTDGLFIISEWMMEEKEDKANEEKTSKKDQKKDEKVTETSVKNNEINSKSYSSEAELNLDSSGFLSHNGYVYLNSVVKEKISSLNSLLAKIANKSTDEVTANQAINQACAMFSTENARVEVVTNEGNDYKTRFKVRDYLNRVKTLKEENTHVSWANINYVGKIQKEVDGSLKGIIIDKQKMVGLNSANINTTKLENVNYEVIFKNSNKTLLGNSKDLYDVLFSDIGVLVTKWLWILYQLVFYI